MANSNPLSSIVVAQALLGTPSKPERRLGRRRRDRRAESQVFLAEHYVESVDPGRLEKLAHEVAAAVDQRGERSSGVSLVGIVGLPSDDSVMSVFSAPALEAVAVTLERAGVPADRIIPVLWRSGRRPTMG